MPITNAPPPAKGAPNKATPVARKSKEAERTEAIAAFGNFASVPLIALKQYADVGAISLHWPNVAREIAKLAESNAQIAKLVDPLTQVGPYAGLITAVLPFAMQIAVNHKRLDPGAMGTVPASSLSAQIETAMAQQELEALKLQFEAEQAAAAMRKEIDDSRRALADSMRDQQKASTGD